MPSFALTRPRPLRNVISLAPMVDVMMILLVFFMVTSTYLDLDMIPAVAQQDRPGESTATPDAADTAGTADPPATLLIRLGADGRPAVGGQPLSVAAFGAFLRERFEAAPETRVIVLPSGGADMQALISVMDTATTAGARNLRVVRLEPRP